MFWTLWSAVVLHRFGWAGSSRAGSKTCAQRLALQNLERLEDRIVPSAGDLDVVFGGGKVTADFSLGQAQIQALAVQANGQIVAAGQAGSGNSEFALARFNLNGTLDANFGSGGE